STEDSWTWSHTLPRPDRRVVVRPRDSRPTSLADSSANTPSMASTAWISSMSRPAPEEHFPMSCRYSYRSSRAVVISTRMNSNPGATKAAGRPRGKAPKARARLGAARPTVVTSRPHCWGDRALCDAPRHQGIGEDPHGLHPRPLRPDRRQRPGQPAARGADAPGLDGGVRGTGAPARPGAA